jgi:hypothetical protein
MTITGLDHVELVRLPLKVQTEVQTWVKELEAIAPPLQDSLAALAQRLGVSPQTARRKYDALRKRGWRGLINRAKLSTTTKTHLAPEFIEWWKALCLENQRKCLPAYRKFVQRFATGAEIPGIGPEVTRCSVLPRGYSYDNLMRYAPTPFEMKAARIGRSAAAVFRPKVATTRVGLNVGQRYVFDDIWHDFEVVEMGSNQRCRLLQLHAHDLASGCQFARGLKPRLKDEASGKSVQLNQNEMLFLLAHVLSEYGYHPDGCVLMVEHGTAAISSEVEKLLEKLSNGKITVDRSGIEGVSSFAGQYPGRGKGNFRFKASLESVGNLIHNETADLALVPGQTGANSRLNAPEELHGRQRHADVLLNALAALPKRIASQLRLPFLEVTQAKWLVNEICEKINQRTEHDLEGWVESGNISTDLLVPGLGTIPPEHYVSLSPERRAVIDAIAVPNPRKLSPREVFNSGRASLIKFRPDQIARMLLLAGDEREVTVGNDHLITFRDKNIAPAPLAYLAHHFRPGDTFKAVVNPWDVGTLHLFDHLSGWVGQVNLWQRPMQMDIEGITEQMGAAAKVERELLAPVASRGVALIRARVADSQHNAALLASAEAGEEPQETIRAADMRQSIKAADVPTPKEVLTTFISVNGVERQIHRCNNQLREILLRLRDSQGSTWDNAKFAQHLGVNRCVVSEYLNERGCLYHGDIPKLERAIGAFLKMLAKRTAPPHLCYIPPS